MLKNKRILKGQSGLSFYGNNSTLATDDMNKIMNNFKISIGQSMSNTNSLFQNNPDALGANLKTTKTVNDFNNYLDKFQGSKETGSTKVSTGFLKNSINPNNAGMLTTGLSMIGRKPDNVSGINTGLGVASSIASMIPGVGQYIGLGLKAVEKIDDWTAKKSKQQVTAGDSAVGYELDFNPRAGTSYGGLFGNKKRRKSDRLSKSQDITNITKIASSKSVLKDIQSGQNSMRDREMSNAQSLTGGTSNYMKLLSARKGMKLNNILKKVKLFQTGGKLNVIPDGALHARKNNLPDEISEQVTNKGIPVVSYDSGGEIIQHAEIEHSEIIFNKELTNKLEEALKKYEESKDDSILIEIGKLLTFEILENTEDNTNLINTIE